MAGVGKLARLLIKMGKKDLVREFSKAPIKTSLKTAGKAAIWPFKKVHTLQDARFSAPAGGKLSIGKRLTNGALNTIKTTSIAGIGGSLAVTVGSAAVSLGTDNEDLQNKAMSIAIKGFDCTVLSSAGFIFGGPIGALAGLAYGIFGEKSPAVNIVGATQGRTDEEIKEITNEVNQYAKAGIKDLYNEGLEFLGLNSTEEADETSKTTVDDSGSKPEITEPVDTTTVAPTDTTRTVIPPDSTQIAAPADSTAAVPADSTRVTPPLPGDSTVVAPADSTQIAPPDSTQVVQPPAADNDDEENEDAVQQTPPSDNIFGGEINGITKASVEIVKGDCLWNIAKRELQAANPGKTITNAQILKQVKEFGRLNPEMFGENPSLQKLDLIYPDKQLKLCA